MRFRKKPVVIEAMQWKGVPNPIGPDAESGMDYFEKFDQWVDKNQGDMKLTYSGSSIFVPTLEGVMTASPGDWIIKGVKGEMYPCKPDIFDATYEPA